MDFQYYPVKLRIVNHTLMRLTFNEEGFGKFQWGQEPFLLYGFEITVFRYDIRRIVCFTSNPKNVIKVKKLLKNTLESDLKIDRIQMDKAYTLDSVYIKNFNIDPIVGISFAISNEILPWPVLTKIFTTGLTTFNMINNKEIIMQIIKFNIELLNSKT